MQMKHWMLIPALAFCAVAMLATAGSAEEITFTYEPGDDGATSVSVRGSFNGWDETPMIEKDGVWSGVIDLETGQTANRCRPATTTTLCVFT